MLPWLIIDDFNAAFSQHDKEGGNPFDNKEIKFATMIIEQESLINLGYTRNDYNWSNGQLGKKHKATDRSRYGQF